MMELMQQAQNKKETFSYIQGLMKYYEQYISPPLLSLSHFLFLLHS